jgi:hypothetical protein
MVIFVASNSTSGMIGSVRRTQDVTIGSVLRQSVAMIVFLFLMGRSASCATLTRALSAKNALSLKLLSLWMPTQAQKQPKQDKSKEVIAFNAITTMIA